MEEGDETDRWASVVSEGEGATRAAGLSVACGLKQEEGRAQRRLASAGEAGPWGWAAQGEEAGLLGRLSGLLRYTGRALGKGEG